MDDLIGYDATDLSELVRKGEVRPGEILDRAAQRIEKLNPRLNAVIHETTDHARRSAESCDRASYEGRPFCGIPFLVKDLIAECKDTPLHEGSRALQGYVSRFDSDLVARLRAGGLIILGKTNTAEFGFLPTTEPALYGPTVNPWKPGLMPGGSSGGSAAAVAAGIVPMAHGNDAAGSIRVPASCCGVFGLKPTRARNPLGPRFGDLGSGIIQEHALTLTVRDSAALLDVTEGPAPGDPYAALPKNRPYREEIRRDPGRLKIGFLTTVPEGWGMETGIHPHCLEAVLDAAGLCEDLGHRVEEASAESLGFPALYKSYGILFTCLAGRVIAHWEELLGRPIPREGLEPATWATYQAGLKRTGAEYLGAVERLQRFSRQMAQWHDQGAYDLLLTPTIRVPPAEIGAFVPSEDDPMGWARMSNTFVTLSYVCNITGQPAMSVPIFWTADHIPIGVQFAAPFGGEAMLFRLAAQLEQARPWAAKKPQLHCSLLP